MAETVTILGLAELEKRLQALPDQIKRGGLILRALRGASRIIRDQARRNVMDKIGGGKVATKSGRINKEYRSKLSSQNRKPGALLSGITDAFSREQELTTLVRVRNKKGYILAKDGNRAAATSPLYWWLLEFGTSRIPAWKFMRNAFESKKVQAAEEIKRGLADEINKANADPAAYALTQQRRRR